ncbi:hypothetical protein BDV93DRAFT_601624 [Ceratobasidium sp. AG-I]|nr:hypothetical protein BDV93DRAFT_601624 [Ceratobasidium sp. AG-I]
MFALASAGAGWDRYKTAPSGGDELISTTTSLPPHSSTPVSNSVARVCILALLPLTPLLLLMALLISRTDSGFSPYPNWLRPHTLDSLGG